MAAQRAQLNNSRGLLDAQLKQAKLLAVEGEQAAGQISTLQRSQFQARLGERTSSILSSLFWSELELDLPNDLRRASLKPDGLMAAAEKAGAWIWAGWR